LFAFIIYCYHFMVNTRFSKIFKFHHRKRSQTPSCDNSTTRPSQKFSARRMSFQSLCNVLRHPAIGEKPFGKIYRFPDSRTDCDLGPLSIVKQLIGIEIQYAISLRKFQQNSSAVAIIGPTMRLISPYLIAVLVGADLE